MKFLPHFSPAALKNNAELNKYLILLSFRDSELCCLHNQTEKKLYNETRWDEGKKEREESGMNIETIKSCTEVFLIHQQQHSPS